MKYFAAKVLKAGLAFTLACILVMGVVLPAGAVSIAATNYDGFPLSASVYQSQQLIVHNINDVTDIHGSLSAKVYEDAGLYTYVLELDPSLTHVSLFSTEFAISEPVVAGYSFSQAGSSAAFDIIRLGDSTVDGPLIYAATAGWAWPDTDPITFFFQTSSFYDLTREENSFGMINSVNCTTSAAPVPEPATMTLFGVGIIMLGLSVTARRRKTGLKK
ncbi:MAG: hypothetical protein DRP62_01685 [Planctomycetota bacterium]|nr:MAG: hypothetical protein DRP62_01685 [Planctomycetota bacterium]